MPAGRGMGMMPPSKYMVTKNYILVIDCHSGTTFYGSAALWHVGASAWVQAARFSSWYAVFCPTRFCWPSSWVSDCLVDDSDKV